MFSDAWHFYENVGYTFCLGTNFIKMIMYIKFIPI